MTQATQPSTKLEDPDWLAHTRHKQVVYTLQGMQEVRVHKDLVYKPVRERDLTADVYTPPDLPEDEKRPGVIFVHGGYLPSNLLTQPKDWGVFSSYGQLMAASGMIGITFNHRYYGRDHLDTAQSDITDLVAYVRDRADDFSLDRDRLSIWAFSGGGPLISWVIRTVPAYLRTLVLYYAILEMRPSPPKDAVQISEAKRLEFSAVHQIEKLAQEIFPIFIARAGLDRPALNETINHFVQAALSKNITLDLSNHAQGQHGFDLLDDDERSRQIIHQTIEFIRFHSKLA